MQVACLFYRIGNFASHVVGRHQKSEGFLLEVSPPGDTLLLSGKGWKRLRVRWGIRRGLLA